MVGLKLKNTPSGGYWTSESVYNIAGSSRAYAEWLGKTYTVTFNSNGGSSVSKHNSYFWRKFSIFLYLQNLAILLQVGILMLKMPKLK